MTSVQQRDDVNQGVRCLSGMAFFSKVWRVALSSVAVVFVFGLSAASAYDVSWRSEAGTGDWDYWGGWGGNWWYSNGWGGQNRPDNDGSQQVKIDNNVQTSMTLNGGSWYNVNTLVLGSSASSSRTIGSSGNGINFNNSGAKIENNSSASHVFNVPIALNTALEINPVNGHLTFNKSVYLKGNWITVWGDNGKTLYLNGVLDRDGGHGGLAIKQNSIVVLTNNNTMAGAIWAEKGVVRLGGHANAMGTTNAVNIGTNATLELEYGTATLSLGSVPLNLYGTGTNAAAGAVRKTGTGTVTWPGAINVNRDAKIRVDAGELKTEGTVAVGANTLYITNAASITESASNITGTKTTDQGTIYKTGTGTLRLRGAGSSSLGTVNIQQGTLTLAGTLAGGQSGSLLILGSGVTLDSTTSSERSISKNMRIDGNVSIDHVATAGTIDLNAGTRTLTVANAVNAGAIANGALTKAGAGTLTIGAASTYMGSTRVAAGTLTLNHISALQNSTLDMNGADSGSVSWSTPSQFTVGGLAGSRSLNLSAKSIWFGNNNSNTTYSGQLSNGTLVKIGTGTLTLSGTSTHTATVVSNGTLVVSGSASSSTVNIAPGGVLAGNGPVGAVTSYGTLSPGTSITNLKVSALTLEQDGVYHWEIANVSGTPGDEWDVITVNNGSGTVTVNATSGNPYVIDVSSMGSTPTGWNGSVDDSWVIISAGTATGFSADKFSVVTTNFTPVHTGSWSVTEDSGDIVLNYTAVVEPLAIWMFQDTPSPSNVAANVTVSDMTISSGSINYQNGTDDGGTRIGNSGTWETGAFTTAGKYIQFSLTPAAGYGVTLSNLTMRVGRTSTGPTLFTVQYSTNGFATAGVTAASDLTISSTDANSLDARSTSTMPGGPITNTVTVRIWGHDATGGGNFRWNNFRIYGDIDHLPALGMNTADVTPSTTLGTGLSQGGFGVTNSGGGLLSYVVSDDVAWLSVASETATNIAPAGTQAHTLTYNLAGLGVGVHTGVVTVAGTGADTNLTINTPKSFRVLVTINAIPDPGTATVTADGNEMIRLNWTPHGSYANVLILEKTSAITEHPTQATAYVVGDLIDGARVIHNGAAAPLEQIVAPGSTHYYRFYSVNNNHYSSGLTGQATVGQYLTHEIVEPFAYTNGLSISALDGGQGWTAGWTVGAGTWTAQTNGELATLVDMPAYPSNTANRLRAQLTSANTEWRARREFTPVSSGRLYVSGIMAVEYGASGKYTGIRLMSNGVERAFFGEGGGNNLLAIDGHGASRVDSSYNINPLESDTNNVYMVIGRYDFDTRDFRIVAYRRGITMPSSEPADGSWDASTTLSVGRADQIDGIELVTGGFDGGLPGRVYFDEVRVAPSWYGLLNQTNPVAVVTPSTLTFNANILQNPTAPKQTFTIRNANYGPLPYTNTLTYGAGASGWLSIAPASGSLGDFVSQSVTAQVTSASLPRGTYIATNTVYGGVAGTNQVVVTLNVTGTVFGVAYDTISGYSGVLHSQNGGVGWSGSWTRNDTSPEPFISSSSIQAFDYYCNGGGDKVQLNSSEAGASGFREAYRDFATISSGVVYFASKMNIANSGQWREAGFKLGDGGTDKIHVGKVVASDSTGYLSALYPDGKNHVSTSWQIFGSTDYLFVGRYDFSSRQLRVKGYSTTLMPGLSEPATWDIDVTVDAGTISQLNRFSLYTRNGLSSENPGVVLWDDIRIARTWSDLMCGVSKPQTYPVVTNAIFSATTTNYVSDAMLNSSNFPVTLYFNDLFGINSASTTHPFFIPDFDIMNADGGLVVNNVQFTGFEHLDAGRTLRASNAVLGTVSSDQINIGTHTLRWSAITSNEAYRTDNPLQQNGSPITFEVYDNDTVGPVASLLFVGDSYTPGDTATVITDKELAQGGVLDIAVRWDDPSGIWHATNNFFNISAEVGNVMPNWDLINPSANELGLDVPFTNYFGGSGSLSVTSVAYRIQAVASGDIELGAWSMTVSAQDMDYNRGYWVSGTGSGDHETRVSRDRMVTTNQLLAFEVIDDDAAPPDLGSAPLRILLGDQLIASTTFPTNRLAGWNFNDTSTPATHVAVSHGAGVYGANTTVTNNSAGTTINMVSGDVAGQDLTITGSANNGRWIQYTINMTGHVDLFMTAAHQRSGTGFNNNQLSWSVDGTNFTNVGSAFDPPLGFTGVTNDFSAVTGINNRSNVTIRITLDGAGVGNYRIDNVQFHARQIYYEVTDAQLAAVDGAGPLRFSFNVYDPLNGLARGTTFNHTNMFIHIDGIATNNTANWSAPTISSADTTVAASTSVWSFTSFTYGQIGDLYADGASNRPIYATMADLDVDRPNDTSYRSNQLFGLLRIIDDDTTPPAIDAAQPLVVMTNTGVASVLSGSGTNIIYTLTDGALRQNGFDLSLKTWDVISGIARSSVAGTHTSNMHVAITGITTNNVTNFNVAASSPTSVATDSTNVWTFGPYTYDQVGDLFADGYVNRQIQASVPDADNDRANDQLWRSGQQFGYIRIIDDDEAPPSISLVGIEGTGGQLTTVGNIAFYDFDLGDETLITNVSLVAAKLSASHISVSSGSISDAAGNPGRAVQSSAGWADTQKYWSVTLTVDAGFRFAVTNIAFDYRATSTSADRWILRSGVDSFASDLTQGDLNNDSTWRITNGAVNVATMTGSVEFRLYGGRSDNASGGGNFGVDNLTFQGRVEPIPGTGFITDSDLATGSWTITGAVQDAISGVFSNGHAQYGTSYTIKNPNGVTIFTNRPFTQGPSSNSAARASVGLFSVMPALDSGDIVLGVYTALVYATDYDQDRPNDWLSVTQTVTFTVVDDDMDPPKKGNQMRVTAPLYLASTNVTGVGAGTNILFAVTDNRMRRISATDPLQFTFFINDQNGLIRGTTDPITQINMTITNFTTKNVANWDAARSSPNIHVGNNMTNVWTFTTAPTYAGIAAMFGSTNAILLNLYDKDEDRAGDQSIALNRQFGRFWVDDDDVSPPTARAFLHPVDGYSTNAALQVYDGGDPDLGYGGSNIWVHHHATIGDPVVNERQRFRIADGHLAELSVSDPLMFRAWVYDGQNGLSRNTVGPETNTSLSVGTIISSNVANFSTTYSAALITNDLTRLPGQSKAAFQSTNYWVFTDPIAYNDIGSMYDAESNVLFITAWDADVDRAGDQSVSNIYLGWLEVYDDDTLGPTAPSGLTVIPSGWTNLNAFTVTWEAAVDTADAATGVSSGIFEYRISTNAVAPMDTTAGVVWNSAGDDSIFTNVLAEAPLGTHTNWIFALDGDNDRPNDRSKGSNQMFVTRFDNIAPTLVTNVVAAEGPDDTSEIILSWDTLPDGGGATINATYNELSPWRSYLVFYTPEEREATTNDPYIGVMNGPSTLGTITTTNAVLSNFVFGTTYRLSVAGLDTAGNIGPLSTSVVHTLSGFNVTQGVARTESTAEIFWTASPGRQYDLIYADAMNFSAALTSQWALVDSGYTNALKDLSVPETGMRFYRAGSKDRWKMDHDPRVASEEVYVARKVHLYPGQNWVAFPGDPDINTVEHIFGVDLPAGSTPATSTRVTWYQRTDTEKATNQIWLASGTPNAWEFSMGGSGSANDRPVALNEGVIIETPSTASFLFVGQVPTNSQVQSIIAGTSTTNFNLAGFRLPRHLHPNEMGLMGSGFVGGTNPFNSDWLLKFDKSNQTLRSVFYRTSDSTWRFTAFPFSPVPAGYFGPDDALMIWTRKSSSSWTWTNAPPYTPPTRFMTP